MAFDFNNEVNEPDYTLINSSFGDGINLKLGEILNSDTYHIGKNTGREYFTSRGYFNANDKYSVKDPMFYLNLFPDTHKNFGIIILEPGECSKLFIEEKELDRLQLVFQQFYGKITPSGVKISDNGTLLHIFKGICKVIKKDDNKYRIYKLYDIFIFDPNKDIK